MTGPEPWELSDAEIWGQLDGAWLLGEFQQSEAEERGPAGVWLSMRGVFEGACAAIARAFQDWQAALQRMSATMAHLITQTWRPLGAIAAACQPDPRPRRSAPLPTLQVALQVNARVPRVTRAARPHHRPQHR